MKKAVLREYLKNLDEPKKIEEITKDPIAKEIKIKEVKTKKGDK